MSPNPPPTTTPDPLRIRNNQRRSRARRKEYLNELESRLHTYEREGVQATAEVQAAARKVIVENERLREENERLRGENERLRRTAPGERGRDDGRLQRSQDTMSTATITTDILKEDEQSSAVPPLDDTSSCEYAAQIITSMRGDAHADDIRAELGCLNEGFCKVDNRMLFVAVDRFSG